MVAVAEPGWPAETVEVEAAQSPLRTMLLISMALLAPGVRLTTKCKKKKN